MRDWEVYVRSHLALQELARGRQARIVRELADQLEDFYRAALARGEREPDADAFARAQIKDWAALAESIRRADRSHARSPVDGWSERLDEAARTKGRGWLMLADLWQEIRDARRQLVRQPGFTVLAVLTMALGIGANTAIFTVVHAVLFRSLPYPDAGRLVVVWADDAKAQDDQSYFSGAAVRDFRERSRAFDSLTGLSPRWSFTLRGRGEPERIFGYFASADILQTFGASPILGRAFTLQDDRAGAPPIAMLTHGAWQRRFGGDPGVIGTSIDLDGEPLTIIGVLPADFRLVDGTGEGELAEVWLPVEANPFVQRGRGVRLLTMIGRLRAGVTHRQAQAELTGIAAQLAQDHPETDAGIGVNLVPLREEVVGGIRPLLVALAIAVGLVLLIACANVANLMLGRATARHRQLAIRAAIGASRWRLARGQLVESALLALTGGLVGLAVAAWGVRVLVAMAPAVLPRRDEIVVDGAVLLFTVAAAGLTSLLFGLAPALHASRLDLQDALKDGSRGTGKRPQRLRSVLVVAEVALSLIVVTGAALLLHSFVKLQRVEPGFSVANIAVMDLSSLGPDAPRRMAVMEAMYERILALPEVLAAGETSRLPLARIGGNPTSNLFIERQPVPPGQEPPIDFRRASRGYFPAMGIPLVSGRLFDERDNAEPETPRVALINQAAADRFFPGEDPVGQRIQFGAPPWLTIVGVVGNIRHTGLDVRPRPEGYIHTLQAPLSNPQLVVRTSGDPLPAVASIRAAIRSVDPGIVVSRVSTMAAVRNASLAGRRFSTVLFGVFAALALVLGMVGIYGVMAYTVAQRRHEIGVRMALGAQRRDVLRMILSEGMKLAGAGTAIGLVAAVGMTRVLRSLLFETSPTDPLTLATAAALLTVVALLACWVPARRAMRADPLVALRSE